MFLLLRQSSMFLERCGRLDRGGMAVDIAAVRRFKLDVAKQFKTLVFEFATTTTRDNNQPFFRWRDTTTAHFFVTSS